MVWRWIGGGFAVVLLVIGGCVFTARVTATNEVNCLVLSDAIYDTGLIDLRTGAALNILTVPHRLQQRSTNLSSNMRQSELSWDQTYFAYSLLNDTARQPQLFVKRADRPGFSPSILIQTSLGAVGVR